MEDGFTGEGNSWLDFVGGINRWGKGRSTVVSYVASESGGEGCIAENYTVAVFLVYGGLGDGREEEKGSEI